MQLEDFVHRSAGLIKAFCQLLLPLNSTLARVGRKNFLGRPVREEVFNRRIFFLKSGLQLRQIVVLWCGLLTVDGYQSSPTEQSQNKTAD